MDIQYGTLTTIVTYVDGVPTAERQIPEMRIKVTNEADVLREFMKFRDETKDMSKASFIIEHTEAGNKQGHYYVVKTFVHKP